MEFIGITVAVSALVIGLLGLVIYACASLGSMWRSWSSLSRRDIGKIDVVENIPTSSSMYDSVKVISFDFEK